jgi:hypothetical protein
MSSYKTMKDLSPPPIISSVRSLVSEKSLDYKAAIGQKLPIPSPQPYTAHGTIVSYHPVTGEKLAQPYTTASLPIQIQATPVNQIDYNNIYCNSPEEDLLYMSGKFIVGSGNQCFHKGILRGREDPNFPWKDPIYCGDMKEVPDNFMRMGTPLECLNIGGLRTVYK